MNITVHQSIHINLLKVGSITNSSVLQIGSTGAIQAKSELYNTGGFTEFAEEAEAQDQISPLVQLSPLNPIT
ncbi:spore gernimation protein KA [Ornithinibacillus sp. BX22]|uniref:Spore gernimation protein KA n=2 Tax=Ornithinibacillus TaxID=484508 RepID=A0A923RHM3_9BACI|nr:MULTISPECIES: spore germination protein GerPB [Ornithinibacillus]MBC5636664.1 spore gernimation protein KA [Ornithinibacillus hominis]MBS3680494.1 spore gernimation protein KA [Ornithinibacillus massiliensis]